MRVLGLESRPCFDFERCKLSPLSHRCLHRQPSAIDNTWKIQNPKEQNIIPREIGVDGSRQPAKPWSRQTASNRKYAGAAFYTYSVRCT
eukprot:scaffold701_cov158-Amphora_coffeaeformis.AAC.13